MAAPPAISPESRAAKFAWAAGLGWGNQVIALVIGLWLTRFLLARLGEGVLGWWAQAMAVVGYLGLIDFGLSALLPREIAAAAARAGDLPGILARYAKFALWQLPAAGGIAVVCFLVLTRDPAAPVAATAGLMAAAALLYPLRVGALALTGLQDVRFGGAVQPAVYLLGVGVTVGAVLAGAGPAGLVASWAAQAALVAGLTCGRLATRYRQILPTARAVLAARVPWRMLADGAWAWLAGIGFGLLMTADLVTIGWFYPPAVVFQYACTVKLAGLANPLVYAVCQAVLPGLTEVRAAGDPARVRRVTLAYTQLVLGLSGLCGCVALAANAGFVSWWVGPDKYLGDRASALAVLGMNLMHWRNAVSVTAMCLGRERVLWQVGTAEGVLAFAATAGWVGYGGPALAPLGLITVVGGVTLPVLLGVIGRQGAVSVRGILAAVAPWAALYALAAAAAAVAGRAVRPDTLPWLALVGGAAAAGYLLLMAGPALRSQAGEYLRPRLGLPPRSAGR